MHGVSNPLKGLKKPRSQPRLVSLSPEDEKTLYEATDEYFGNFLFAGIRSGVRHPCTLRWSTIGLTHEALTAHGAPSI